MDCFLAQFLLLSSSICLLGISTKKNVAQNVSKDLAANQLWGSSSIPFGGTLPSRGAYGKVPFIPASCRSSRLIIVTSFYSGTNTIPGGYMPSFSKDSGSAGHRGRQGVATETTASSICTACVFTYCVCAIYGQSTTNNPTLALDYATWRSGRSHLNASVNTPTANKSTPGLLPRPPLQTIHGRTDWSAKYGHR